MNETHKRALLYVHNTGGGASFDDFVEDHEPIGRKLWAELATAGWVTIAATGRIALTESGKQAIA